MTANIRKLSERALCHYHNQTTHLHGLRSTNPKLWSFERVVFLGERLLFEAPPAVELEIQSGEAAVAIPAMRIQCGRLQVKSPLEG